MKSLNYRGPGEHSTRELEIMLAEAQERISNLNSVSEEEIRNAARVIRFDGYNATQDTFRDGFLAGSNFILQREY